MQVLSQSVTELLKESPVLCLYGGQGLELDSPHLMSGYLGC